VPFQATNIAIRTGDGRNVILLEDLIYVSESGQVIIAPIGNRSDGASTPKEIWALIPPFGLYWLAALLHDGGYQDSLWQMLPDGTKVKLTLTKEQCDLLLLEAMVSLGVDLLLREAGWGLDRPEDTEFRVEGMPNNEGTGFVDYVLWGADGKPLGLVEAKRTRKDARVGQQQAKLYADCLEARFGQRPVIFYSNGYEHWIWDDTRYPPRQIGGFYKRDELELLVQRRTARKPLGPEPINRRIVERPYQHRAIRSIATHFEADGERKALLVMATGAGKTRTVIALVDLLMRAGWV